MTRTVVRLVILAAFVAGLSAPVVARADTFPVIASGGGRPHGWVAIEWTNASGAEGVLSVSNASVNGPGFVSLFLYDASGRAMGGGNVGILGSLGDVHVQADVPPLPAANQTVVTSHSTPYGGAVNMTFDSQLPPGTYKALFIAGGDALGGWTWALKGNAAVSAPTATTSGSDVYAYSAKDFSGTTSTQAYAGLNGVSSLGVSANVATERSITAAHALLGMGFFAPGTKANIDMRMDGPSGSRTCNCVLTHATGAGAASAGTWRFSYTGAGAGTSNFADVLLGVADAYLP